MANANQMYDEATALKESGDLEAAAAKLQEVLQVDEKHVLSHMALAVIQQKLGNHDEALRHATRVTELEPNDSFSWTQLSVICQRCGRIPEAEDAMARAHMVQQRGH